jgi:hypothetical protein
MVGKLLMVSGVCLAMTGLLMSVGSVAQQDDSAKLRASEQMRDIANSIKQCPEEESTHLEGECSTDYYYVGPPTNVD